MSNHMGPTFGTTADATRITPTRFRKHNPLLWLAITVSAAVVFAPLSTLAQVCISNTNTGCSNPNAVCSPVFMGVGPSGKCKPSGDPGERECLCVGAPEPTIDPRCGDQTATGKIECTIDQPVVKQHETEYSAVKFAPGDIVDVNADGCVQTGGVGDTWKRYVNPTGRNSDHFYHGLVRIPTGTKDSALVRISTVIGRHLQVTGAGVPVSQLVLHLGYEDDDYSHNSYNDHDNGTEDQCKTANGNDGGPAHVTITIYRGVDPDPPKSRYDFDVLSSSVDPNGFLLNPHWSWQDKPGNHGKIPLARNCHVFSKWDRLRRPGPNFPDCTDQAGLDSVDQPEEPNSTICDIYKEHAIIGSIIGTDVLHPPFAGHVNWFPVTITGKANWEGHGVDDDYTLKLLSDNAEEFSLYLNDLPDEHRRYLHVEFDSDETIDHFQTDAWIKVHDAVEVSDLAKTELQNCFTNGVTNGTCDASRIAQLQEAVDLPRKYFDGDTTIMTGMFGFDGEHGDGKSELHPLYAMATRRNCAHPETDNCPFDPSDDIWLIFVRNRGDEGFCSSQLWDAGFEDYTFRLPWSPGMTTVDVDWNKTKFNGPDGTSGPIVRTVPPPPELSGVARRRGIHGLFDSGVYVTFHLGPAASSPFIEGTLHLKWTGPPGRPRPPLVLDGTSVEGSAARRSISGLFQPGAGDNEVEQKLQATINQLAPGQRQRVEKARRIASVRPPVVHRLPPTGSVQRMTQPPPTARSGGLHAIKAGPAVHKTERDAAQMRALCAASDNAPAGLPAGVCKPPRHQPLLPNPGGK